MNDKNRMGEYEKKQLMSYVGIHAGSMRYGKRVTDVNLSKNAAYATVFIGDENEQREIHTELYAVDVSLMDRLAELVIRNEVYDAVIDRERKYIVYDEGFSSYRFEYADGSTIYISNGMEVSGTFITAKREINALIAEYKSNGEKYSVELLHNDEKSEEMRRLIDEKRKEHFQPVYTMPTIPISKI